MLRQELQGMLHKRRARVWFHQQNSQNKGNAKADILCVAVQAPDGHIFYSYAKAQEHWQALGESPLRQTSTDASISSRRVARLPEGWEVKAIHKDIGKGQGQVWLCLLYLLSVPVTMHVGVMVCPAGNKVLATLSWNQGFLHL